MGKLLKAEVHTYCEIYIVTFLCGILQQILEYWF